MSSVHEHADGVAHLEDHVQLRERHHDEQQYERQDGHRSATLPATIIDSMAAVTVDDVQEALENVIDPELGLDFVELGLVYDIAVEGEEVFITFSLTSRGLPDRPAGVRADGGVRGRARGRRSRLPEARRSRPSGRRTACPKTRSSRSASRPGRRVTPPPRAHGLVPGRPRARHARSRGRCCCAWPRASCRRRCAWRGRGGSWPSASATRWRDGYAEAVQAARGGGFEAIERLAGGRAAVFHEDTIAFAHAIPDADPRSGVDGRFEQTAALLAEPSRRSAWTRGWARSRASTARAPTA